MDLDLDVDLASFSSDVLEALLELEPSYAWADLDAAPLPFPGCPSQFLVSTKTVNETALSIGMGLIGSLAGRSAKRKAERIVQSNEPWEKDTFPFGYAAARPPERSSSLLVLKKGDPIPQSSIIQSPYMRISPYTYCVRTSTNWRTDRRLQTKASLSYLPFFGEDNYQEEDEFRDRLFENSVRAKFVIPNEEEVDPPIPRPSNAICGICLAVGCIVHRAFSLSLSLPPAAHSM